MDSNMEVPVRHENMSAVIVPTKPAFESQRHAERVGMAMTFLGALFEPNDTILLRPVETFHDNGRKKSRCDYQGVKHLQFAQPQSERTLADAVARTERTRCNLFFGINPRFGAKHDLGWQIRTARTIWADVDHTTVAEVRERVARAGLPPPTVVVGSGHGAHLFWKLSDPWLIDDVGDPPAVEEEWPPQGQKGPPRHYIEHEGLRLYLEESQDLFTPSPKARRLQAVVDGVADLIGGDHVGNPDRLMRVAGTLNRKNQRHGTEPIEALLVECAPQRTYPFAEFERYARSTSARGRTTVGKGRSSKPALRGAAKLDQYLNACASADEGARSEADFALCCFAVRSGIDRDDLWAKVEAIGKFAEQGRRYFDVTWANAATAADRPAASHDVGGITLVPGRPHATASKVTVPVEIRVDGRAVDRVRLSDSASGRKTATQHIKTYLADAASEIHAALERTIGEILVNAQTPESDEADGVMVYEVLKEHVSEQANLVYRTASNRAFSEKLGKEITRQGFIEWFTNSAVLDLAEEAADAPRDENGDVNRPALIAVVERELKVLWGDLTKDLPAQDDAPVGPKSTAGVDFRSALVRVWTRPASMALNKHAIPQKSGEDLSVQLACRTSLATRVREAIQARDARAAPASDQRWHSIQKGYSAWYRCGVGDGGEVVTFLALRWELALQIGVDLPGVHDQCTLTKLGLKFGVLDPSPPVTGIINGQQRIAVLTQEVTQEVLFDPTLDDITMSEAPSLSLPEVDAAQNNTPE